MKPMPRPTGPKPKRPDVAEREALEKAGALPRPEYPGTGRDLLEARRMPIPKRDP